MMDHATVPLEAPLPDDMAIDPLIAASARYREVLIEYCHLACLSDLSDQDAQRMEAILTQATQDPLLSFWLDEADYWLADQLNLLDEEWTQQQQVKLKRLIGQTWVDSIWSDLQNRTKALQAYLQRLGLYTGDIDGIMGPNTRLAIESLRNGYPDDLPLEFG
jgi:hypothetical protein